MAQLVIAWGFVVEDDVDLLDVARRLPTPTAPGQSVRDARVAVARFAGRRHRCPFGVVAAVGGREDPAL
ncbi:hypothetical protein [Actinomadura geliboluensis]|uniref:hypothetical protein n=1 Tax=Actinomadura geliboluensis TaxID=882440 RepID=UPI003677C647